MNRLLCIALGILILVGKAGQLVFGSMWTEANKRAEAKRR